MAANTTVDIIINQKSSFQVTFAVLDNGSALNLTGYTTAAKMKPDFETPDSQAITFTTAVANAAAGTININLFNMRLASLIVFDLMMIISIPVSFIEFNILYNIFN